MAVNTYRITRHDGRVVQIAAETYDEATWIANGNHLATAEAPNKEDSQ